MLKGSVVTIGVFDGVHMGHRAVIKEAVRLARLKGLESIVITFDPHPLKVLSGRHMAPSLISLKHRIDLIKALGVDRVAVLRFDKALASMPADRFVKKLLIEKMLARVIVVGEDFCFGRRAASDTGELCRIARGYSADVRIVRHVIRNGRAVSSTIIRRLVEKGDIKEASALLGRPFSILGTVVGGARLARSLGYPTANVNPHHEAMPPSGVYAVRVRCLGKVYDGVMNIGTKPTFYDHGRDKEPSIEVHIFRFHRRIYGRCLEITFVRRLRAERKFKSIDSLIAQIRKDEFSARSVL